MAPASQDIFDQICAFVRSSHVSGLFARFLTAGPDGFRKPSPYQLCGL